MALINVTGVDKEVPVCPDHPTIALIPEPRETTTSRVFGFWRCPLDHQVYREESPSAL